MILTNNKNETKFFRTEWLKSDKHVMFKDKEEEKEYRAKVDEKYQNLINEIKNFMEK